MADFGDFLSGAGSGALAGFGAGGPLGAAVGGIGGGLISLFSQKNKPQEHISDPYQGQIDAGINSLMSSHAGAQIAQNQAAGYRRDARAAFDSIQSNPGISGNANVMNAAYNKTQLAAADASTNAAAHGALIDQQARTQGLQLAHSRSGQQLQMQQYNNAIDQANQQPNFFQQILQSSVSSLAGRGIARLMGDGAPEVDPSGSGDALNGTKGLGVDVNVPAGYGSITDRAGVGTGANAGFSDLSMDDWFARSLGSGFRKPSLTPIGP